MEEEPPAEATPLGELFVDPTSPESLAPWLLLLDANALFVIHMVDPQARRTFKRRPCPWLDLRMATAGQIPS